MERTQGRLTDKCLISEPSPPSSPCPLTGRLGGVSLLGRSRRSRRSRVQTSPEGNGRHLAQWRTSRTTRGLRCDKVPPCPCGVETKMCCVLLGRGLHSSPSTRAGLGHLLTFPREPASLSPVLSKAVLDGVPGHTDTWPRMSVPTVPSLLLLASLSLQVNQDPFQSTDLERLKVP